jgi:hypothetical protein
MVGFHSYCLSARMLTWWQVYTPMEMTMVVAAISRALFLHSYSSHPTTARGRAVGYGGTHMMNLDLENVCSSCNYHYNGETAARLRGASHISWGF